MHCDWQLAAPPPRHEAPGHGHEPRLHPLPQRVKQPRPGPAHPHRMGGLRQRRGGSLHHPPPGRRQGRRGPKYAGPGRGHWGERPGPGDSRQHVLGQHRPRLPHLLPGQPRQHGTGRLAGGPWHGVHRARGDLDIRPTDAWQQAAWLLNRRTGPGNLVRREPLKL